MTNYITQDGKSFEPIKVGKPGKLFELLVKRLEDSLKTDSDVTIIPDHKIVDFTGIERQFDVFIISQVQGYPIEIAIECKDNGKKKVDVDKIEAFKSKCERIPSINSKVFVSQIGYTKGAIATANIYGITLLSIKNINDLDDKEIHSWTKPINFYLQKRFIKLELIIVNDKDGNKSSVSNYDTHTIEFSGFDQPPVSLRQFCTSYLINLPHSEWNEHFTSKDRQTPVKCSYRIYPKKPMIIGCEHVKNSYQFLDFHASIYEETIELVKTDAKSYTVFEKDAEKAQFVEMIGKGNAGEKVIAELILSSNKPTITINYSVIEDKKIVCSESNTFYINDLLQEED